MRHSGAGVRFRVRTCIDMVACVAGGIFAREFARGGKKVSRKNGEASPTTEEIAAPPLKHPPKESRQLHRLGIMASRRCTN